MTFEQCSYDTKQLSLCSKLDYQMNDVGILPDS